MPFVQRVVRPVNIAQVVDNGSAASVSGQEPISIKYPTIAKQCSNNNCINKTNRQLTQENGSTEVETTTTSDVVDSFQTPHHDLPLNGSDIAERTTKVLIHSPSLNCNTSALETTQTNGFTTSFSYATDTDEDLTLTNLRLTTPTSPTIRTAQLPIKKLKQHVEFLSTAPSPSRNQSRSADSRPIAGSSSNGGGGSSRLPHNQRRRTASAPQSPTAAKVIAGYEFDSISNITLSNALRQLASLVLLASDIFDDLQKELQDIGDRSLIVQKKIITVEQRVCAYDPKTVTVPESDLLTFAQRKVHYESKKVIENGLFSKESRPYSVRQLYEEAGKITPPRSLSALFGSPQSPKLMNGLDDNVNGLANGEAGAGVLNGYAAGSDDCICTPVFGRANRTMRTRIDAEIEIRLPAAIEDLRKWTSSEALGDVTVTPDCMHHVDTSINTSIIIGDNGVLTPALSPSVLSADAVDAMYAINASHLNDNIPISSDINKDVPLNHRLPSPEEQLKIIALKYPAEIISVDTSGKRFQRMCMARKSTTGCYSSQMPEQNNLNDEIHTVSRRSRSRKVRGKRRNTIAGIDQKEIQDAANGETTTTTANGEQGNQMLSGNASATNGVEDAGSRNASTVQNPNDKHKKFSRSKSSDILKKDSVALPYDKGKSTLTRLNSLKQWGRNRFKFMQRNDQQLGDILDTSGSSEQSERAQKSEPLNNSSLAKASGPISSPKNATGLLKNKQREGAEESGNGGEALKQKSESRFSHERKPSYSSSEKSMNVSSSGHLRGKLHLATCGNVKMRDTSTLNRQRRNGILANGLGSKDDQPHSSSGNWSASSESGRASIGSEITLQPKSSASNTSLNVSSFHPSSGPPSSMLSRRRFMNTSASSSVTSEGTATPDLQTVDGSYPNHMDDETGSAYSCDTEGYYTSFHMDSGLRTLKEEEPPSTPLQASQNLHASSSYSFGSQSNQTVLNAENEYELFGKGSTSTTTSSAGTVCTTLMMNAEQSSIASGGPEVPERISSLSKLTKSSHSNSASTSTLERSYSSSTIGSTLERTGTIKRNVNASTLKISNADSPNVDHEDDDFDTDKEDKDLHRDRERSLSIATPESQDTESDFEHKIRKRGAQPLPPNALFNEMDCSESSDLEGVERIERIKQKTALNANRIPSMCIITPTTSDDENQSKDHFDPNRTLTNESSPTTKAAAKAEASLLKVNQSQTNTTGIYSSIADKPEQHVAQKANSKAESFKDYNLNDVKKSPPFNSMLEKLKVVLPSMKKSPNKNMSNRNLYSQDEDGIYDPEGEYVYIADISNNNRHHLLEGPKVVGNSSLGIYYSSDKLAKQTQEVEPLQHYQSPQENQRQTHQQHKQGKEQNVETKEYISLNELPLHLRRLSNTKANGVAIATNTGNDNDNDNDGCRKFPYTTNESEAAKLYSMESSAGANSVQPAYVESSSIPMYAEINELREEKSLYEPLSDQKGARVRLNAHGKIIYDSDSLKRRKSAHSTFQPGPFVKESESALPIPAQQISEINTNALNDYATSKAVKLLLLNGGVAANRKVANVRPIVAKSPLARSNLSEPKAKTMSEVYIEQKANVLPNNCNAYHQHADNKQLMANQSNPFFQNTLPMMPSPSTKSTSSTGSTISSTPSTLTSSSSSNSSHSASSKEDTGYQPFYRSYGCEPKKQLPKHSQISDVYETVDESFNKHSDRQQQQQRQHEEANREQPQEGHLQSPFQRSNQIYWTLQNRKQPKKVEIASTTCRDDLYATPIRRSERLARAANANNSNNAASNQAEGQVKNNISPIIPRNRNGAFLTSTPTRDGGSLDLESLRTSLLRPSSQYQDNDNDPNRLKTCSDRIGQNKTSLMDFKKLLLAKSAKSSPVQRKVSAVELLKKANPSSTDSTSPIPINGTTSTQADQKEDPNDASNIKSLNSSMKLLDLSGSPKTFANRRMLRQGQFGSPSKSLNSKIKPSPLTWRASPNAQRTDIISSTIMEASNSEEEKSNNSNSSGASISSLESSVNNNTAAIETNYDLKRNFFIQSDENNFMRSELKANQNRHFNSSNSSINNATNSNQSLNKLNMLANGATTITTSSTAPTANHLLNDKFRNSTANMPALETAL